MGSNSEEDPFIMGVFYNLTCPSKWVLFQTFNTHIRVENVQVDPPGEILDCLPFVYHVL